MLFSKRTVKYIKWPVYNCNKCLDLWLGSVGTVNYNHKLLSIFHIFYIKKKIKTCMFLKTDALTSLKMIIWSLEIHILQQVKKLKKNFRDVFQWNSKGIGSIQTFLAYHALYLACLWRFHIRLSTGTQAVNPHLWELLGYSNLVVWFIIYLVSHSINSTFPMTMNNDFFTTPPVKVNRAFTIYQKIFKTFLPLRYIWLLLEY